MKQITWIVLGWIVLSCAAQAASFDCAKASTKVEKLICGDAEISKLDDELNAAYKAALQDVKQAVTVKQAQKQWLKERNGCADAACVKGAYEVRLSSLKVKHMSSDAEVATKHEVALTAQVKTEVPTPSHVDEACLAPKIDWRNYEWTLITGNGLPVCEEMLAYVKTRPSDMAPPTCPEERLPPNGNWTRPEIRDVNEEERQAILRDIPERYRQKPKGPVSYERMIKEDHLRVIRGDITRDGIPESFLALGGYTDLQLACERSKRCGRPGEIVNHWIELTSDFYDLLPMNDEGTQVNWSHRTLGLSPILMRGELIYYKGIPYWMTKASWFQYFQDHFSIRQPRPDDPYSAIFTLAEIFVGTGKREDMNPNFKNVTAVSIDRDPESNRVCRFGYFHRENLKQNPPKTRR